MNKVLQTTSAILALLMPAAGALAQKDSGKPAQRPIKGLQQPPLKFSSLFDDLGPVASGTGAVILEPVASGLDPESMRLTAGCSRWLQFVVGGHGELGKTTS